MSNVIFLTGYSGSGKTSLAKILAKKTSYAMLEKDTLTHGFVEALVETEGDRESANYLDKVRPLEYEVLENTVKENASLGVSLIVSAPYLAEFNKDGFWDSKRAEAAENGVNLFVVWVQSDKDTMRQRIIDRGAKRDGYKLANWADYADTIVLDLGVKDADYVVNNSKDATETLEQQADEILKQLGVEVN